MMDEDRIRLRDRRWVWLTGRIALWVLIAALSTALLVTMAASIVAAFQAAAAPGDEHWSDRTGPVGDTFGGLLGPFLNALVLGVTVVLAVAWQPRRDRRQKAESMVAWLARSDADDQGVVITNGAGAIAHDVGVRFRAKENGRSDLVLWEAHVPPGEWFVPYRLQGDEPGAGPDWRAAVNIDLDAMSVQLRGRHDDDARTAYLRPDASTTYGRLSGVRFRLFGRSWRIDAFGTLRVAGPLSEVERAGRDEFAAMNREVVTPTAEVSDETAQLMRRTVAALCGSDAAFDAALDGPQRVVAKGFPANAMVTRERRQRKSFAIELAGEDALTVRLMGSGDIFPAGVWVTDKNGVEVRTGLSGHDKFLNHFAREAAVATFGGSGVGALRRPAGEWLSDPAFEEWMTAVAAMVAVAANGVEKTLSERGVTPPATSSAPTPATDNLITAHDAVH